MSRNPDNNCVFHGGPRDGEKRDATTMFDEICSPVKLGEQKVRGPSKSELHIYRPSPMTPCVHGVVHYWYKGVRQG